MWTKNVIRLGNFGSENQDSDQSISEEEDYEGEETGTSISLDGLEDNKAGLSVQVLSQLELLRDSYELHSAKELISSHEGKGGYRKDDGLGFSLFDEDNITECHPRIPIPTHKKPNAGMRYLQTKVSISHSDEIISDDEKIDCPTLGSARGTVDCTWSEASREVEALVCLNDNSSCPPLRYSSIKERKFSKGGEGRNIVKPKFVFLHDSHKNDPSMAISDRHGRTSSANSPTTDEIEAAAEEDSYEPLSDSQLICHNNESQEKENRIVPFEQVQKHDFKGLSMAEFLCGFDKSSNQLQGTIEHDINKREERMPIALKRNTSELLDTNQAEDDPLESLDSQTPTSTDDEENHQNQQLVVPCRTMTDQFHEAFGTVSAIDDGSHITSPWPLSNGMHGKLQQVMQREKERDMVYSKKLSEKTGFNDEKTCISVRILTRSLEAKLIVCSCAPVEDRKGSYWGSNVEMKFKGVRSTLTIIFNPRISNDVELEVGNLICIHAPWYEFCRHLN